MAEFPLFSESLLSGIQQFGPVAKWLRHQMENFDGTGYPDKLRGEEIPIEARLLRAVNSIESLGTATLENSELLEDQLKRTRNTILDPRIVQLLREYIELQHHPSLLEGKRQLSVFDLCEVMTIAADVSTGSGKKLLVKDSHITQIMVERILAQHHFDPIISGIYVYEVNPQEERIPAKYNRMNKYSPQEKRRSCTSHSSFIPCFHESLLEKELRANAKFLRLV